MLKPLEGKCFTYSPATTTTTTTDEEEGEEAREEGEGQTATASLPFVFQWCHGGRATVQVEGTRSPKVGSAGCAGSVLTVCVQRA